MTTAGIPRGMRTKIQFADYASAAPWNSRSRGATWKRISHLAIATPPPPHPPTRKSLTSQGCSRKKFTHRGTGTGT